MKMEMMAEMCAGIPGAISVLVELMNAGNTAGILRLHSLGIVGSGIWILYKDRCACDVNELGKLLALQDGEEIKRLAVDRR